MENPIRFWLAAIVLHAIVEENAAQLPVPVYVEPISLTGIAGQTCAADGDRQAAMDSLGSTIRGELQSTVVPFLTRMHPCGIGNWQHVFTLNTTDPNQTCPGDWSLDTSQTRACAGLPVQCVSAYSNVTTGAYNEVCGRLLGDAIGSPDAFFRHITGGDKVEGNYLDGVSVTYGATGSRTHVWTFGTGHAGRCPCDNNNRSVAPLPISAVGENYFCDTDDGSGYLWGGCTNTGSCCNFHDPPYFKVRLTAPTTERMELRICNDQTSGDESVLVIVADLYVK